MIIHSKPYKSIIFCFDKGFGCMWRQQQCKFEIPIMHKWLIWNNYGVDHGLKRDKESLIKRIFHQQNHLFNVNCKFFNNPFFVWINLYLLVKSHNFKEIDQQLIRVSNNLFIGSLWQLNCKIFIIRTEETLWTFKNWQCILTYPGLLTISYDTFQQDDLLNKFLFCWYRSMQSIQKF